MADQGLAWARTRQPASQSDRSSSDTLSEPHERGPVFWRPGACVHDPPALITLPGDSRGPSFVELGSLLVRGDHFHRSPGGQCFPTANLSGSIQRPQASTLFRKVCRDLPDLHVGVFLTSHPPLPTLQKPCQVLVLNTFSATTNWTGVPSIRGTPWYGAGHRAERRLKNSY
jgi:hypothetical protein